MSASRPTARWSVPLSDGIHVVEFEHGTATGRRVVKIDGQTLIHRDWMFRLVGDEVVTLGNTKFVICVDPLPGLRYSYTLLVNNKTYANFIQSQSKVLQTWLTQVGEQHFRIVLDKAKQSVWINGKQIDVENEFVDGGAEMLFSVGGAPAVIRALSSGHRTTGVSHTLFLNGIEVTEQQLLPQMETRARVKK
ncbi:fas apoptotic inhibitory molecule 1 isoform X1 [Neodiprion pinetum]|uniref:Fas apoptotic inhibitory molecule 1 n=2 Tax=Neodiprion TaxID=270857 RepID=A0A6J0BNP3_NEOLC|nr:fas apoptotic inhibitory molecule 1 [Neodiprion lecontei]XP_046476761.1 fas apoptotic inhibitory molecule 1 [Neodiprion pinetum]XP_046617587.1 fas apoptotic inhibitory molecule 1 [Neodiprion virginianus]